MHTFGIPMIALSLLLIPLSFFVAGMWRIALGLFVIGWILQFIGHYFEGKPPEFMKDYRFLFVGLRWWFKKVRAGPDLFFINIILQRSLILALDIGTSSVRASLYDQQANPLPRASVKVTTSFAQHREGGFEIDPDDGFSKSSRR
jgi:hypothetical protein